MDYAGSVGSATGQLLPTGAAVDTVVLDDGRAVPASVCDVANPCVFVAASDLGLRGNERPEEIEGNPALVAAVEEVRGRLGQALGFWPNWRTGGLPAMPMLVIVAPTPADEPADLRARLLYLGKCHPTIAGTGAICLAAASRVPGSVVRTVLRPGRATSDLLRIGHPSGTLEVRVVLDGEGFGEDVGFRDLGFASTARRLMAGRVSLPHVAPGNSGHC